MTSHGLPDDITVFERGWLSSNNILFIGCEQTALVDTGYATHSEQTRGLVRRRLGERSLDLVLYTHLHSDHCGGNATLQREFPALRTMIPPGQADAVARWDTVALTYATTGQSCERFRFDSLLQPGDEVQLGNALWQIHAAPGHDPHSVILFEPASKVLMSADALWQNGFGLVFPELEGNSAFDQVGATLDLIERLQPRRVIPGHGSVFGGTGEVAAALARARSRLESFEKDPGRHTRHAAKVLLKFKLLEVQQVAWCELEDWALRTPYFALMIARCCGDDDARPWLQSLAQELVNAGVATMFGDQIQNA
jgi:glyoxylase-like metal-dependent hydrolase (beta-lactamase superfamily II)